MALSDLSANSRVWIFQSSLPFTTDQETYITHSLKQFLADWNTHGSAMHTDFEIAMNQVVIVAADEEKMAASGCSIDKLTREIQRIGSELQLNLLDRQTIFYQENGEIKTAPISTFWALRKANRIDDETLVLDTTIKNITEWRTDVWKKFGLSWHKEMYGR